MTNPLPKNLALAQLRLRSITAGMATDLASLPIGAPGALGFDDGRNGYRHDHDVTVVRFSASDPGADPRVMHISVRELLALARLESDHPARAPIADPPTKLSAPPPAEARRIVGMMAAVYQVVKDGEWRTLDQIHRALLANGHHHEQPAISARLRDLRKAQFGGHTVERKAVPGQRGLHRYRVLLRTPA